MATTLTPQSAPTVRQPAEATQAAQGRIPARRGARRAMDSRAVLAASGGIMLGYVLLHLSGNLLAFAGADAFNAYARSLRTLGAPVVGGGALLMLGRAVLAGALVAHLGAHLRIMRRGAPCPSTAAASSAGGCPSAAPYLPTPPAYAAYPLPIMRASGGVILLFVILHLAQLTFGATVPAFDPGNPYHNLVVALRAWPVSLAYVAVAAAVGAHLLPGVWSGMQSLHLIRPSTERLARAVAPAVALTASVGMAVVPVAAALGVVH